MPHSLTNLAPREPEHSGATLFVAPPGAAEVERLRGALLEAGLPVAEPFQNVLAIALGDDRSSLLASTLIQALGEGERRTTRCRLMHGSEMPAPADLMHTESLGEFLDRLAGQWLGEVLAHGRLVTYFQPIVRCAQPNQVFAYECLTRGRDAQCQIISPDRLYAAARATGQLMELDRAARLKAIASSAARQLSTNVFVNFNPRSIGDPLECVESTVRAVLTCGLDPAQFVFEVVESDEIVDTNQLLQILAHYREAGFRVALDDLGAGYSSLNLLATVKPDFVKLDMGLVHHVDHDVYKAQVAGKLLELARDLGVRTVVEGVETSAEWEWSRDHGADFAQGYLFARPSPVPASVDPPLAAFGIPSFNGSLTP